MGYSPELKCYFFFIYNFITNNHRILYYFGIKMETNIYIFAKHKLIYLKLLNYDLITYRFMWTKHNRCK